MIIDALLEFADAQSVSGSSAVQATNVRDLGASEVDAWGTSITPDIGENGELEFNISVDTAMVGAGITLACALMTKAADATLTSGATTLATLTLPALSAAGTAMSVKVPSGTVLRYTGVVFTPSGALTSSNINAFINLDHEKID